MEYFPLSLSQKNILNLERVFPGTSVNNICATIGMDGDVDFELLQESIHLVLEKDSSIHIRLCDKDGEMMQYHAPYRRENYPIYDFGHASVEGFSQWEKAEAAKPFSLEGAFYHFELFRLGEGKGGFLIKLHHIIGDGWSALSICNKIGNTYLELLEGKEITLLEAPDYEKYVMEEQEYLHSKAFERDEAYWKKVLDRGGEPALLKTDNCAQISPVGKRISFELPERLNQAIYRFCEEKRVSPFAVFYMALAVYLRRTGTGERFAIGVPVLNRTNYRWKQTTGMFVTTLPFYNEIKEEWTLHEFNENLRDNWYELLKHQKYPFTKISQMAGGDGRLFHVGLSYQNGQFMEHGNAAVAFSGKWHYAGYQAEQLMIHMTSLFKNRQYAIDYDYQVQFFNEAEIERLHHNLCEIMTKALDYPDSPLSSFPILCSEQKEQVLYTFNRTEQYYKEMPVYDALVENSREYMERTAVICGNRRMSYGELLAKSTVLAGKLLERSLQQEDLVAILLPREELLLVSMTASLQAGGAYVVLSEETPAERVKKILKNSGAKILITNQANKKQLGDTDIEEMLVEEVFDAEKKEGILYPVQYELSKDSGKPLGERLAYVVYTSGSTGEPKGAEITHSNLMNLAWEMKHIYGDGAVLSVCNTGFDAFMLESMTALLNGRTVVFPDREELETPGSLASLIRGYRVGTICLTPSRLAAFMRDSSFAEAAFRLESIICGGEAFPTELLRRLKKYTHARIYNQYGPSETTVAVSFKELSRSGKITAGHPMGNCRIYILDRWMKPVPVESCGHIYIGGRCVGRGYRNAPKLTEQAFQKSPFVVGERIYDTGDIGYWTPDGELVLTGRKDDQIKLRGLRVELQEISSCIESYKGVTKALATVRTLNGQQVIGVYYCAEEPVDEALLLVYAAAYLPKYMIPAFVMHMDQIPVSANGKADLRRLPLPDLCSEEKNFLTDTEKTVLDIFRQVLKREELKTGDDYFLFGGDSLNAMECIVKIEERMGIRIRVADLYACRNAAKMASYLDNKQRKDGKNTFAPIRKRWIKAQDDCRSYPMSPVQQGMYIQSMLDPAGLSYNMPGAFLLAEKPDFHLLEEAFCHLIGEDALLRTSFRQGREGICAYIEEAVSFELEQVEAETFEQAAKAFVRPFNLGKAPLIRGGIWHGEEGWYLLLDSHHIIGDGMSTPLLLERLDLFYQEKTPSIPWNYYDYMTNVVLAQDDKTKKEDLSYWTENLKNLPETLKLPGDYSASSKFDFKGADLEYELAEKTSTACIKYCKEKGISEFVLFLSAYGILLSRVSGRDDFIIGAPAAGRLEAESRGIVGPFINTLPLRLSPDREGSVKEWMQKVSQTVTGMIDHQQVSLEELIQELHLPRGEQNALYQVMITQSPVDEQGFVLGARPMEYRPISTGCVKMDLILELSKSGQGYKLRFSYADKIFREETIRFYGRCMEQILIELMKDQERSLSSLNVLAPEDVKQYVQIPKETKVPFEELPIHTILKNISLAKGEETAIIYHDEEYSYDWLERRAGAIAGFIEGKGIKPGTPIALCLSRRPEMIAAMYGVLKAGCAYVFMLPSFPEARLTYMVEITKAEIFFYDDSAYEKIPSEFFDKMTGCQAFLLPEGENKDYKDRMIGSDYLVNVLFTSGSTGKPKGVMLKHRSVSNLYSQMDRLLQPIKGRVLCSTNTVFDCFVVETLIALALGRCVVLADEEEMMLPWKLARLVSTYHTAVFEMTPSRLQMCLGNEAFCSAARHIGIVLLGGEVVTKTLMEKFYQHSSGILMNMYGPTEATVFTTMEPLKSGEHITIGRSLQNTRTYVLDDKLRPVMPTACGELYIAGECLAEGYISRPELNEVSFLDDIYYPGEKMYRSGDLVRLRVDGRFDYIGRKDAQVKLNGQRVELSEITGAVIESGYADQAAVVPIRKADGSMELCAFYEKAGETDSEETGKSIREYLKKVLPVYMIPSQLKKIDKMPMTATNKIDLQLLKNMAAGEGPEAEQQSESNYILSVWNRVLSHPATDMNRSFFELGGTSMDALNVLSHYFNDHFEMTISQFYENPTAAMQTALLEKSRQDDCRNPERKTAFVTGATGFFGAHLVKELLDQGKTVFCLMRDGKEERLKDCLIWYFGRETVESFWDRIRIVKGNIREERLGLTKQEYEELTGFVGEIYHCAADVRHYAPDEADYFKTNVDGTRHMLDLAKASGKAFYHMSTCSVAGSCLKERQDAPFAEFTEADYDIGQNWEDNIYVKSKFFAENLVKEEIEKGMQAKIFRLGRLVGRNSDGRFQKNPETNSFYLHVQGLCRLGVIPDHMKQVPVDLMPVDLAAKEVAALTKGSHPVYHIMSHNPPTMLEGLRAVNGQVNPAGEEEMEYRLRQVMKELPGQFLPFLMELKMDKGSEGTFVKVTNDVTVQQLRDFGFDMEISGPEQLLKEFRG